VLEITENLVLASLEKVQRQMNQLKSLGVGFALDDFGTGHSALYYLKQLPFNQLKIDRSFVRDIHEDPNDAAIVRAILAMSRSLGLETVAEGVETREQLDYLVEHGCTMFQGYLFAKPMPIANWPDKPDPSPRTGGPAGRPPMG
jgi:EAL domain-containing protein (putative c-di-GMP-specific phosphodiesterase class I)